MNLRHSYHALSPKDQQIWRIVRWMIPYRLRWFFEGCLQIPGQLWVADRKMLYRTIRRVKPQTVFEVGTWLGGGSTYFISQALHDNGFGMLHTIEADAHRHTAAQQNYKAHLPHLVKHVTFHSGKAMEIYPRLLRQLGSIDTVFLDGSADPQEAYGEFEMFAQYLHQGSVVLMHDWDNEKMALLRPAVERSAEWHIEQTITAPQSVGFAIIRHIGVTGMSGHQEPLHSIQGSELRLS
uniref:O-methyltransferase n=1 Tax=Nitrospira cf. moscoviensis SBR1015 TaxID=96242 RepID=UPI000A364C99|nr:class I SAM-dependent methyltransferase [Nitrospira cf. moscoviensis SBR1015]